jgi:hypothetical protein
MGAAGAAASIVSLALTLWLGSNGGGGDLPGDRRPSGEAEGAGQGSETEPGAVHQLSFGEPVPLPEVGVVVAAEPTTRFEQEMIRLAVSSDDGGSAVQAVFPGDSADFPLPLSGPVGAPAEVLSIHVLSVDRAARTVAVRALRRPAVEGE